MILKTNNNRNIDKMMMIIIMIVTAIIMRRAITNLLSTGLFDILKECNLSKGGKHSRLLSPQVLSEFQKLHKSVALLLFDEQNNWFVLFVPASSLLYDTYSRLPPSINTCNRFQIFFRPPKDPHFGFPFFSPPIPISQSPREWHTYFTTRPFSFCQYDNDENKDFLMTWLF